MRVHYSMGAIWGRGGGGGGGGVGEWHQLATAQKLARKMLLVAARYNVNDTIAD